jgi:hypothetical protein
MDGVTGFLWTIIVAFMVVWAGAMLTVDKVYTGNRIPPFYTGRDIVITGQSAVTIKAVSQYQFNLYRDDSNATIGGTPAQPDLECPTATCFKYGPEDVKSGTWHFGSGHAATFTVTSDQPVTVTLVEPDAVGIWGFLTILGFIIWIMVIAAASI